MPIEENITAPDFTLPDETGKPHKLSEFHGKPVLLYFYPQDDTPGCTTEACNFRDDYSAYQKAGVVILGVSPDSPDLTPNLRQNTIYPLPCWRMKAIRSMTFTVFGD